jgi:hypothetical protein
VGIRPCDECSAVGLLGVLRVGHTLARCHRVTLRQCLCTSLVFAIRLVAHRQHVFDVVLLDNMQFWLAQGGCNAGANACRNVHVAMLLVVCWHYDAYGFFCHVLHQAAITVNCWWPAACTSYHAPDRVYVGGKNCVVQYVGVDCVWFTRANTARQLLVDCNDNVWLVRLP